ncbi:MAG: hypothetical protein U0269_22945 [Polyangiales bacterium]
MGGSPAAVTVASSVRIRALATLFALVGLGCRPTATQVQVVLGTDAPASQRIFVRASVEGSSVAAPRWDLSDAGSRDFLGSFTVLPARDSAPDSRVTVLVEATLRTSESPRTEVTFQRRVSFGFLPHQKGTVRVFIATGCFAAATGCTRAASCTVAARCDEQGLTCGDEGACVRPEVTVMPDGQDGGLDARRPSMDAALDGARSDVVTELAARCPGATECAGMCVNVADDPRHCGGCGRACAAGQGCIMGVCTACAAPRLMCGADCINPDNTVQHCGGCGRSCPSRPNADARCSGGACSISCVGSFANCDRNDSNGCEVDTSNDRNHCGACGRSCGADRACVGGACVCAAGRSDCGGTCLPTGAACSEGTGACMRAGRVVCTGTGMTGCDAVPGAPGAEVCNGADDNCDGTVDEDPACVECLTIPTVNVWPLNLTRGDREFNGHGPNVSISVDWSIAGNQIAANACVTAEETVSDWTTGSACRTSMSAPAMGAIDAVLDPPFRGGYLDGDHSCDFVAGGAGVTGATCVGDTSGDDICASPDTCGQPECTGCEVRFGCVRVRRRP